ncbi:MAG: NAD(P)H-hydrate dehydratase [Actinobacteria bacterium]|nr:NAD(P)H-hydrate dehydratase [Actinomycetota bacterium]
MSGSPRGIPEHASAGTADAPRLVTPALLREWPLPEPTGTKLGRGRVVVVGGARKTPGGAMLGGLAALRMGAGRLSLAVAESVAAQVAVAIPESGVHGLRESASGSVTGAGAADILAPELEHADGLLVGPGLDDPAGTIRLLEEVVPVYAADRAIVLDAFGATVLPDVADGCRKALAGRTLLTPNTNELARLARRTELDEDDVPAAALEVGEEFGAIVSCGGWITADGGVWRITTGDTGLGTSGSGDVLAGAVVGLVARGVAPLPAMLWATYVHASAGDRLATEFGRVGFLAGELLPQLPRALRLLRGD